MSKNLHKKFIEETGQVLRYTSWKRNRKMKIKTQTTSKENSKVYKKKKNGLKKLKRKWGRIYVKDSNPVVN